MNSTLRPPRCQCYLLQLLLCAVATGCAGAPKEESRGGTAAHPAKPVANSPVKLDAGELKEEAAQRLADDMLRELSERSEQLLDEDPSEKRSEENSKDQR